VAKNKNMKSKNQLKQQHALLLDLVKQGKDEIAIASFEEYSVEELEQLLDFCWEDKVGIDLYKIFLNCRKKKMNKLFIFNEENIKAILHIDQQLKSSCQQLKKEAEREFPRLIERKKAKEDEWFFTWLSGLIKINAGEPFLEIALSFQEKLLSFSVALGSDNLDNDKINKLPLFDFTTNYAQSLEINNELESHHIGYAFYKLFSESYLSLQDIIEIVGIRVDINSFYSFTTYAKFHSKNI